MTRQGASYFGHTAVVKLLIQHGADVHARDNEAVRKASKNGHADVVQLLIKHGAVLRTEPVHHVDEKPPEDLSSLHEEDADN